MNMKHLRTFLVTAKCLNISKASVQLNYSQSTIFEHLKALETETNTKLYSRTQHGILLTDKGVQFAAYAEKALDLYYGMLKEMNTSTHSISVGASESSDYMISQVLIREFVKKYPHVDIEYSKMSTDVSIAKVLSHECDVSFVCEPELQTSGVAVRLLCPLSLSFVASPLHASVRHGAKKTKEFNTLLGTMKLPIAVSMLEKRGLHFDDYFSSIKNIGDLNILHDLTCAGNGIAVLPTTYIKSDLESGRLCVLPDLAFDFSFSVYIMTSLEENTANNPTLDEFINMAWELYGTKVSHQL